MKRFRLYWDKDKEEKFLNRIAGTGYVMTGYFLGVYEFRPCGNEIYTHRIDLRKNQSEQQKEEYIQFVEETGAEYVCSWNSWMYFRKKGRKFELYSDPKSKIEHYRNIFQFFRFLGCIEFVIFLAELSNVWVNGPYILMVILTVMIGAMTVLLANITFRSYRKLNQIKMESFLDEENQTF